MGQETKKNKKNKKRTFGKAFDKTKRKDRIDWLTEEKKEKCEKNHNVPNERYYIVVTTTRVYIEIAIE